MQVVQLPHEQVAGLGYNRAIKVTHEDITTTATNTAQVIPVLNVAAGDVVQASAFVLKTPLSDASDTAFNSNTATLGDGGSANRFVASTQLNANGTPVYYAAGSGTPYVYTAADTVDLTINSMTAKALSDLDGGELWVLLRIGRLGEFRGAIE